MISQYICSQKPAGFQAQDKNASFCDYKILQYTQKYNFLLLAWSHSFDHKLLQPLECWRRSEDVINPLVLKCALKKADRSLFLNCQPG